MTGVAARRERSFVIRIESPRNRPAPAKGKRTGATTPPLPPRPPSAAGPRVPLSARRPQKEAAGDALPPSVAASSADGAGLAAAACFGPLYWAAEVEAERKARSGKLPQVGDMVTPAGCRDMEGPEGSVLRCTDDAIVAAVRGTQAVVRVLRTGATEGPFPLRMLRLSPHPSAGELAAARSIVKLGAGQERDLRRGARRVALRQRDRAAARRAFLGGEARAAADPTLPPLWRAFVAARPDGDGLVPASDFVKAALKADSRARVNPAAVRTPTSPMSPSLLAGGETRGDRSPSGDKLQATVSALPWGNRLLQRMQEQGEHPISWAEVTSFASTARREEERVQQLQAHPERKPRRWFGRDRPWAKRRAAAVKSEQAAAVLGVALTGLPGKKPGSKQRGLTAKESDKRPQLKHFHGKIQGLVCDSATGIITGGTVSDQGVRTRFPHGVSIAGLHQSSLAAPLADGDRLVYDVAVPDNDRVSPRILRFRRQQGQPGVVPLAPAALGQPPQAPVPPSTHVPTPPPPQKRRSPRPEAAALVPKPPSDQADLPRALLRRPPPGPSSPPRSAPAPDGDERAAATTPPAQCLDATHRLGTPTFGGVAEVAPAVDATSVPAAAVAKREVPRGVELRCGDLPADHEAVQAWTFGSAGTYVLRKALVVNQQPVWVMKTGSQQRYMFSESSGRWKVTDNTADFGDGRGWMVSAPHKGSSPDAVSEWRQRASRGPPFYEPGPTALVYAGQSHTLHVVRCDDAVLPQDSDEGGMAVFSLPTAAAAERALGSRVASEDGGGSSAGQDSRGWGGASDDAEEPKRHQDTPEAVERRDSATRSGISAETFATMEAEFQRLFQLADVNSSGGLTLREFVSLREKCSDADRRFFTKQWFDRIDSSGDGVVRFPEFLKQVLPDAEFHWARRIGKTWGVRAKDRDRVSEEVRKREENPVGWWCCGPVAGGDGARAERLQYKIVDEGGVYAFEQTMGGKRLHGRLTETTAAQGGPVEPAPDGSFPREGQKEWKCSFEGVGQMRLRLHDGLMESLWQPAGGGRLQWNIATMRPLRILSSEIPQIFELWAKRSAAIQARVREGGRRQGWSGAPIAPPTVLKFGDLRRNILPRSMDDESLAKMVMDGKQSITQDDFVRFMRGVYGKGGQQTHNDVKLYFQDDPSLPPGVTTQQLELPEMT
eukprot:TRINITY_DN39949_c0_g1_i1.p1 TRINITY_DN39949_c0_g1~~TRINITY_DN39949_c0_g1_i1.p1  ORF type:complete len:1191 (+),score=330.38 TRINITY_DN39949_c0_g1_i1:56-3574(+)